MVDDKTIEEIIIALTRIVERLNSTENRLRSLEEASTTALKRLTLLESDMKNLLRKGNEKISGLEESIETLGLKYVEIAKLAERLSHEVKSGAQKQEVERLRTLVEVLK